MRVHKKEALFSLKKVGKIFFPRKLRYEENFTPSNMICHLTRIILMILMNLKIGLKNMIFNCLLESTIFQKFRNLYWYIDNSSCIETSVDLFFFPFSTKNWKKIKDRKNLKSKKRTEIGQFSSWFRCWLYLILFLQKRSNFPVLKMFIFGLFFHASSFLCLSCFDKRSYSILLIHHLSKI